MLKSLKSNGIPSYEESPVYLKLAIFFLGLRSPRWSNITWQRLAKEYLATYCEVALAGMPSWTVPWYWPTGGGGGALFETGDQRVFSNYSGSHFFIGLPGKVYSGVLQRQVHKKSKSNFRFKKSSVTFVWFLNSEPVFTL